MGSDTFSLNDMDISFDVLKIRLLFSVSLTYMESRLGGACIKEEDDPEDMRGDHYFSPVYPYYIWTD